MVQFLLRLTAPPGRLQQTIQALRSVMLPVRLTRGVAQASLSAEVEDANVLHYVEEWPDVERLNEEIRSARFGRILALMETAAEAPTLEFRFIAECQGLEYVAEVRGEPRLVDCK